jgi:hypothetical protein
MVNRKTGRGGIVMPLGYASAAVGIASGVKSLTSKSPKGNKIYSPRNLEGVDIDWNKAFNQTGNIAQQAYDTTTPYYQQSLTQGQNIDYDPYLQASQQAGNIYGGLGQQAMGQVGQYNASAQQALQQQQALYGAGNQLWQTASDPQNALYDRTQQQLQDQVRAGQAARGLGNSAVGGAEENQAMSNFNIDWQNQQLQRQLSGVQGMGQASNAGGAQGQLYGADLAAALGAGQQAAGFTQQQAQVPLSAQQYAAQQPGQLASQYQGQLGQLQSMYGNQAQLAIPYMNQGQGAQGFNANYAANQAATQQQNVAGGTQALLGGLNQAYQTYNQPGSWLQNVFSGSGGGGDSSSGYNSGYTPFQNQSSNNYGWSLAGG